MIDLHACQEEYQERSIDNVDSVKSCKTFANGFKKLNNAEVVKQVMRTGTATTAADQWIARSEGGLETTN